MRLAAPFVRTVARTSTWTVRPCCRRLRPSVSRFRQGLLTSGPDIVADHRIQLHITKTLMMRPLPVLDGRRLSLLGLKSISKSTKFLEIITRVRDPCRCRA